MSVEKSVVRIGVAREIGSALDDALEGAVAESHRFTGAKTALDQTAAMVQKLSLLVDASLEGDGPEAGQIPDLTTAKLVKKFITRAVAVVSSGAIAAEQKRLMADGKVQALTGAIKGIKRRVDAEEAALAAVAAEPVGVEPEKRAPGTRPASTVKTRRLAEETAEKAPSSAPKPSAKRPRAKSKPKAKRAGEPKRRGRRPKTDGSDTG